MSKYLNLFANVFFMGQNRSFSDANDLLNPYRKMVDFSRCSNYIIIGLRKKGSVENMKSIEKVLTKEFGARFEYLATNDLEGANLTSTSADV